MLTNAPYPLDDTPARPFTFFDPVLHDVHCNPLRNTTGWLEIPTTAQAAAQSPSRLDDPAPPCLSLETWQQTAEQDRGDSALTHRVVGGRRRRATRRVRLATATATRCLHPVIAKLGWAMLASSGPPGGTTAPEPALLLPQHSAGSTHRNGVTGLLRVWAHAQMKIS